MNQRKITLRIMYMRETNENFEEDIYSYADWLEEKVIDHELSFYCQNDIEGHAICFKQCEHCKQYFKPLEQ